jgi:lantibiotic modifying enzyme
LDILDTADVRIDITRALKTTMKYINEGPDHLCCGNFGRLELLLSAAIRFSDEKLLRDTLNKAGEIISVSEQNGMFRYAASGGATPGLFQGISGIRYQILRLAFPDDLPSVLLLD